MKYRTIESWAKDETIQADAWRQPERMADAPLKDSKGEIIREGLKDASELENSLTDARTYQLIEQMVTG